MALQVVHGATLSCSFGAAPSSLVVLPRNRTLCANVPAATIMDHMPMTNIEPFGMCSSPANPQVIAATAAALGVFTPQPCVPMTLAPWAPGAVTVYIGNEAALDDAATCNCLWVGAVAVIQPGQAATEVP
jgi:hypothetical protein